LSRQYHNEKDETVFVEDGCLHLDLSRNDDEDNILVLGENHSYRIKPGTIHRFTAPKTNGVTLLEASTPHLNDVVRLSDDYGRADA
jgi:mannose-1-phosphate guanylyltransferase